MTTQTKNIIILGGRYSGGQIPADIIIWAGGFVASPLAREAGLQVNPQNQVLVDPYLRSLSHPNIVIAGRKLSALAGKMIE